MRASNKKMRFRAAPSPGVQVRPSVPLGTNVNSRRFDILTTFACLHLREGMAPAKPAYASVMRKLLIFRPHGTRALVVPEAAKARDWQLQQVLAGTTN